MGIASLSLASVTRNDDCTDYQGEGMDIGAGGVDVHPFSLHLVNGVIAKEEE
jgi:hypothetical protein